MNLVWLRRDLRLNDNHALSEALKASANETKSASPKEAGGVQLLFIFDPEILEKIQDPKDARVAFIYDCLESLQVELKKRGAELWIFHDKPSDVFKKLFKEHDVSGLFLNHDYEPSALKRDAAVEKLCKAEGVDYRSFKDQVIFEKDEIQTDKGTPYTVYGAYKKKWLKALTAEVTKAFPSDGVHLTKNLRKTKQPKKFPSLESLGFEKGSPHPIPPLKISKKLIEVYEKQRDFPAVEGTTRIGLHLRFGTQSIRELVADAKKLNAVYLSELIWREFFMQILFHFPETVTKAFRPEYDLMPWRNAPADFKKWCEGKTGVPLVDAGMRQLNETGFMHNRVRMITASYLTKHLMIDWRNGEAYFAAKLLDYEQSSNIGNWQWVAGSGCDAAPYFRIFNPEIQQKRFDPKKEYIRKWVPEFETADYPEPLVEHAEGRDRAMRAYLSLRSKKPIK